MNSVTVRTIKGLHVVYINGTRTSRQFADAAMAQREADTLSAELNA